MNRPIFLEDPRAELKDAYRMESGLLPRVRAMIVTLEGDWLPMALEPVLMLGSSFEDPNEYLGFAGLLPTWRTTLEVLGTFTVEQEKVFNRQGAFSFDYVHTTPLILPRTATPSGPRPCTETESKEPQFVEDGRDVL